jgi:hypothetical protein
LPPIPDSELAAGFNNFWMLSDRPLNYSLIAAFLCLGLVAPGNKWAIWLRAIWSGETDAMIANSDETGSRRLLRITVAGIVGALAAALFVEVIRADMDAAIWPTVVTSDSFVLPACQLITIVAAWRLARRKSGVMLALAMVSAYLLCVAVIQGDLQYLIIGVPAMFGLVCVAAFVRRGHLKPGSFNDDRGRGYRHP